MSSQPEHYGVVEREGDTLTLRFERHYPVSVDAVWAALVEPDQLAAWLPEGRLTPGEGGHIDFDWGEQGSGRAPITTWEPPRLLELEWVETAGPPSRVRIELASAEGGTRLVLAHSRVREDAAGNATGWHYYLDALQAHLEGASAPGEAAFEAYWAEYTGRLEGAGG